jgi:hypothetical protein
MVMREDAEGKRYVIDTNTGPSDWTTSGWVPLDNLRPLGEALEEEDKWEIVMIMGSERIWKRVPSWLERNYDPDFRRDLEVTESELDVGIPYYLQAQDQYSRLWINLLTEEQVVERRYREIAVAEEPITINAIDQFKIGVVMNGISVRVMLDSGAMGTFMDPDFARDNLFRTHPKNEPYQLRLLGGKDAGLDGWIKRQTYPVEVRMPTGHIEKIVFDIVPLGIHAAVLGTTWIRKHNPSIDWVKGTLKFDRCDCRTE